MVATCKLGEKGCWNDGKCRATSNCENKVFTNADRIRSMTDEELADLLMNEMWKCDKYAVCRECPRYIGECCLPIDEWLQQPCEEDG